MEWRSIKKFPAYEVSEEGDVRRVGKYGENTKRKVPFILKPQLSRQGYKTVGFYIKSKRHTMSVHRLVAEAFIGPRPLGKQCCHNDGDKLNCRVSNLRYDTASSNERDKVIHGGAERLRNIMRKLSDRDISKIFRLRAAGKNYMQIGKKMGVHGTTVMRLCTGKLWRHYEHADRIREPKSK